ncbi:MAG: aromatic ring-hydroxylating dioxygenase subunit alpha [Novosphingobium sp.]|jgi:choline monooxygenase|nr:aromatic ring-hydroxylating dioxygenase subunit alpha [Novosphingobium sp.]
MTKLFKHADHQADIAAGGRVLPGNIPQSAFEAVCRPLEQAQVLPPKAYTDPDFYRFEVEKVLMHSWLPAGRADQVRNPGDYFTWRRFGETAIIVRGGDGAIHAFSAACRHRGYPVASGAGNCGKRGFTCPYHGWRYRVDGSLAAAPYMQEGFDPADWALPRFGVEVWQGFIFVNFDRDAAPLSPQLTTLDEAIAPFNTAALKCSTMRTKPWVGNWKATLDNFTEAYHQPFVHPTTFEPWAPARKGIYDAVDGPYNLFWLPSKDGDDIHTVWDPMPGLEGRYRNSFIVVNVFPLFHALIDPSCWVVLDMDPTGPDGLIARWDVLVTEEVFNRPTFEAERDHLTELLVPTWNEDEHACAQVGLGQGSRFAEQGQYSWMERSVHQFHRWMAERYCAQDPA